MSFGICRTTRGLPMLPQMNDIDIVPAQKGFKAYIRLWCGRVVVKEIECSSMESGAHVVESIREWLREWERMS